MKRAQIKPEFYKSFMQKGFFPNSNKIVKYQESHNYWIFKTGQKIYKIKKVDREQSTASLEESFCLEIIRRIQLQSPRLEPEIATIKKIGNAYLLDLDNSNAAPALYFLIVMNQLPERYFIDVFIEKDRLTEKIMERVCDYLSQFHQLTETSKAKEEGNSETLNSRLQDLFYQSKKFLGLTVSQAYIDIMLRPLEKYLVKNRKTFLRRIKNGRVKQVHGCFIPRKINVQKNEVLTLAKTTDPFKGRYRDVASDIADFTVELEHTGQKKLAACFVEKYCKITGDEELEQVLPIYQAMKCLSLGLGYSIEMKRKEHDSSDMKKLASVYYEQAIDVVHHL